MIINSLAIIVLAIGVIAQSLAIRAMQRDIRGAHRALNYAFGRLVRLEERDR